MSYSPHLGSAFVIEVESSDDCLTKRGMEKRETWANSERGKPEKAQGLWLHHSLLFC